MGKDKKKRLDNKKLKRTGIGIKWRKSSGMTQQQWAEQVKIVTKK